MTDGFPADWKTIDHAHHALDQLDDALTRAGVTAPPRAHEHITTLRACVDDQEHELQRLTRELEEAQDKEPHW